MAYLTAVPTDDFLKLLNDEALEEVVSYSFIGHDDHDNEALAEIIGGGVPTLEELQDYIYHTADIDTSYYDSKGVPTYEVMINADEAFSKYNYALILLTRDNKIASFALTPKIVFAEGIGGVLYTKIAINTDGDCNSEIIFKNTGYLTIEELKEVWLKDLKHDHPYLPIHGKADDSDKLDGKDYTWFAPKTHTHPYLPIHGKADDSDKLDGIDGVDFKSNAEFISFSNVSFPARAEESWADITSLNKMTGKNFDVLDHGIVKFKKAGVYSIKIKIVSDSNIIGADKTRVKITAWQKANHFYPTNDRWDAVEVEIKCYLWVGYELRFAYDSGRLHTWHDSRFSYINITRIGQLQ